MESYLSNLDFGYFIGQIVTDVDTEEVTDLKTGKSSIAHIDYINTYWAPYSFGKIIIKGRESLRAEVSRKADKLPDMYIFKISDMITENIVNWSNFRN